MHTNANIRTCGNNITLANYFEKTKKNNFEIEVDYEKWKAYFI